MAIAKMKLVNIVGPLKDFDRVVQRGCLNGNFHAEKASSVLKGYEDFLPFDDPNPYEKPLKDAVDIGLHNGVVFQYRDFSSLHTTTEQAGQYLSARRAELSGMHETIRDLTQQTERLKQGLTQLYHIRDLPVPLDELFACRYLKIRFGYMPQDSFQKLSALDKEIPVFFFPLDRDGVSCWGFYISLPQDVSKADQFFSSLYFERVRIIEDVSGTPARAAAEIKKLLDSKTAELKTARRTLDDYLDGNRAEFLRVYSWLKFRHDSFELRKYAVRCGDSFYLFGWVPESEIAAFSKKFEGLPSVDCIVQSEQEADAIDIQPPTKLINKPIFRPYESFVRMYGTPNYNEIDPTPLFAITYSLFFGIMFGDLGQGLLLFILAALYRFKKKSNLGGVLMRCSAFSMIFGTLYNSFFGYEDLLPIPTVLPIHKASSVNYILLFSVAMGILFIFVCMFFNMANGVRQRDPDKVFFSNNGAAGLLLYAFLISAVVGAVVYNRNLMTPKLIVPMVVVPLLLMFLHEPLTRLIQHRRDWLPKAKGEYAIESFFKLFEVLLTYLSNTISYVRIGAYVLCHSGMMLAVFTVASLSGHGQNMAAVIIGNLFVMALEALMVGIQDMRLEFYEMFSRFYQGNGREYRPLRVRYNG